MASVAIGTVVLYLVNKFYWNYQGYEGSHDDEMKMLDLIMYIQWPILALIVALTACMHKMITILNTMVRDDQVWQGV